MKKILWVVFVVLFLASCNYQTKVENDGIPTKFEWVEFWNGGGMIGRYENASMKIEIITTYSIAGADIYFYKYVITGMSNGVKVRETIIDSEALALKYEEEVNE